MIRSGNVKSGYARSAHLRTFAIWAINGEGTGVDRASPVQSIISRCRLNMTNAMIAPLRAARKWRTDYSAHKNSFHNPNDRPRLGFERSWLYVVPSSLIAEPRAIPHAQSPKAV
jgi:hypothetical protein